MWPSCRSIFPALRPLLANLSSRLTAAQCPTNTESMRSYHAFTKASLGTPMNFTSIFVQSAARVEQLLKPFGPKTMPPVCGFKVKGRLKRRCKDCYFVVRQDRRYVICKTHPRHKQMAMKKKDDKFWILTHATQSPVRPW